ncbi:MAG: hypothetical protein ACSW8K_03075, partial [bacterium]
DITGDAGKIVFTMDPKAAIHVERIPMLLKKYRGALTFNAKGTPSFTCLYKPSGLIVKDEQVLLNSVEGLLLDFSMLR